MANGGWTQALVYRVRTQTADPPKPGLLPSLAGLRMATGITDTRLRQAMQRSAATPRRWRRRHHVLAVRMHGERTGTGYAEGAAYLHAVQTIPVFTAVGHEDAGSEAAAGTFMEAVPTMATRGRCPFAAGGAAWNVPTG